MYEKEYNSKGFAWEIKTYNLILFKVPKNKLAKNTICNLTIKCHFAGRIVINGHDKLIVSLITSVTRWSDYFSVFGYLQQCKLAQ